jgi:16S rRNA (cytosine1402-N4)-methyltransferase
VHKPVLLDKTISYWAGDPKATYVDCTLGGGGHLKKLLEVVGEDASIIAIDKDDQVLQATRHQFSNPRIRFVHGDFRNLGEILYSYGVQEVEGILIDLGVSSFQLDVAERGFSYHKDALLDMRMDQQQTLTAWEIVNHYPEEDLANILFHYAEERFAKRIARGIVQYRNKGSIDSTLQLVEIIKNSVPAKYAREKHPGRKTFQALRIAVNSELEALREVLPQAVAALKPGGRLCIITFHSLEDRMVKEFFKDRARECICPPGMPICTCSHRAELEILTRRPIVADETECEENPRARSAKLRVAKKAVLHLGEAE